MPSTESRLDYLDATRAFALLLGVVFHAALSFLPFFIGWAVQDISTSGWVAVLGTISHSFRMELFFLLAGFFSHMTLGRKGLADLLRSRALRIIIPFVVGWFILRPLIVSGWIMGGASMQGDYEFWPSILGGIAQLREMPEGPLVGTHLWFLYYLVLITTCVLVGRFLVRLVTGNSETLSSRIDQSVAWLGTSRWGLPLAVTPIVVTLGFMNNWGMDTPDKSLIPHVPALLIHGGFFTLGWLLHRQPETLITFSRITPGRLVALVLSIVCVVMLMKIQGDPGHPKFQVARNLYHVGYAVMMWTLVWLTIGLFRRCFTRPNATVRYIADSSYWMYLIHLPIVVWLQVVVAEWELPWSLKLIGISLTTIAIALITYDFFVRSTWLGKLLNGRRRPRALFGSL
ncbi:acyltransferase family protein [Opitutaceae bacterium]|nr:acyltransferase family protein [Opitutaceae bacterium]